MFFSHADDAKPTTITILTESTYYPYSYNDQNGELKGIYLDIVEAGAATLDEYKIEFVGTTWKSGLSALRKGRYPFILGVYYHGYDWDFLYPYSQPLLNEEVVVICAPDTITGSAKWPEDYKGKLVTHIAGYDGWLNNKVRAKENTRVMNLLEVPNVMTAWEMLHHNRADCSLFESLVYSYASKFLPMKGVKPEVITQVSTETVHIALSKAWSETANEHDKAKAKLFLKQFDDALYQLKRTGEVRNIINNFHPGK